MRKIIEAGLLIALAAPTVAMAQSAINGTWKLDVGALPFSTQIECVDLARRKISVQVMYATD